MKLKAILSAVFTVLLIGYFTGSTLAQTRNISSRGQKQAQLKAFIGSWEGVFTAEEGGPPPFQIMLTFGSDGTVIGSDVGPPTPQLANPEHGAWERTGDNEFTIIYKQLIVDENGNLANTFKGRVKFILDPAKSEISGIVKVNLYDAEGHELINGEGTIRCQKIRVERF